MCRIHLVDRDLALLDELGEVVLEDRETIQRRHFRGSLRYTQHRLRQLVENQLLAKIELRVTFARNPRGSIQSLFRLAPRGAETLHSHFGRPPRRMLRTDPKPETLRHRLAVARTALSINDAILLAGLPKPEWIFEQDMRPGAALNASRTERFILYEDLSDPNGRLHKCRPDASVHLLARQPNGDQWDELILYVEADQSTETLSRFPPVVEAYRLLLSSPSPVAPRPALFRRHWPKAREPVLRVLYVCKSDQRIKSIADSVREIPGAEYLRFTTYDDLADPRRLLTDPIFRKVDGQRSALPSSFQPRA